MLHVVPPPLRVKLPLLTKPATFALLLLVAALPGSICG
jgi:hypothetical protein